MPLALLNFNLALVLRFVRSTENKVKQVVSLRSIWFYFLCLSCMAAGVWLIPGFFKVHWEILIYKVTSEHGFARMKVKYLTT